MSKMLVNQLVKNMRHKLGRKDRTAHEAEPLPRAPYFSGVVTNTAHCILVAGL
jgi:hypothetical protein